MKMVDPQERRTKAPPQWIIDRIEMVNDKFLNPKVSSITIAHFKGIMENNIYWTHIHKCCTENNGKLKSQRNSPIPAFNRRNATICSRRWLDGELTEAVKMNAHVIICLGRNVESEVNKWYDNANVPEGVEVIYLPHPSTAANGVWYSEDMSIRKTLDGNIVKLLKMSERFAI